MNSRICMQYADAANCGHGQYGRHSIKPLMIPYDFDLNSKIPEIPLGASPPSMGWQTLRGRIIHIPPHATFGGDFKWRDWVRYIQSLSHSETQSMKQNAGKQPSIGLRGDMQRERAMDN